MKCCVLACSFFVINTLFSQDVFSKYDFIEIKESISKAAISSITQDHNGFIWFGSSGAGLFRYDGIDYKYYKHDLNDSTSISSNVVTGTYIDHNNRMWVGTDDGLNLYNKDMDQFKRVPILKHSQYRPSILSLQGDNEGNLFVGTIANGLFKLFTNP
ncbi:two-component regulator propeller domain-containing protein [Flavivirga abyssicola]|uniref:ligand-binding sensor domain-containing protein n=1 Tax=Flavivirga abyssicola TaxID=3063533 RepID=UPI0026DF06AA|nr:two-component regulator propeller domain-containing protein [Flavivirga sp. MEBiC07777]WVK11682.1 two-component regulator propeller domain-containing protein [Flavivirga sp. MEBiC07777]